MLIQHSFSQFDRSALGCQTNSSINSNGTDQCDGPNGHNGSRVVTHCQPPPPSTTASNMSMVPLLMTAYGSLRCRKQSILVEQSKCRHHGWTLNPDNAIVCNCHQILSAMESSVDEHNDLDCDEYEQPNPESPFVSIDNNSSLEGKNFVQPTNGTLPGANAGHCESSPSSQPSSTGRVAQAWTELDNELIGLIHNLRRRQNMEDAHNRRMHEWRLLSMFIDKILFWIFTTVTVAISVTFLLIIPMQRRNGSLIH